ncbi:putative p-nitrophenylphosphatase [Leptomonas pyrrhocoris]|uniref:Putative p-nitrophenylphosphatase n=1 Tax=Leptomonas pyrrhocoris TaxID=157538 RepID=A0A0N0DR96_LEPPY|nr:putative p-nitrophenylphosphatase [Leptomonas pyrrhocoris]KPA74392.1 putative p-nitrophenylphosphatase [Leptomonas pyrrhocoris]|eukprot:XP_015652831.1 putative p-nitrophenylphosphatase [Leptomonas pyrrhocoris]
MAVTLSTNAQVADLLDDVDYFLLDLDGVVLLGDSVIPHIPETLRHLRESGKQIRFISNTILLEREGLMRHLHAAGIAGVAMHEIYTAAYTCALYLQENFAQREDHLIHRNVFVLGPSGLNNEVQSMLAAGYSTYGPELTSIPYSPDLVARAWTEPLLPLPSHTDENNHPHPLKKTKISLKELDPVAVVVGVDYNMNMTEMACAVALLQCTTARFVATNPDPADPAGARLLLLPSSGAIVAAVQTAVGRAPDVLCGKPSPTMGLLLMEKEAQEGRRVDPQRAVMVGDRLMTDICFGKKIGVRTALALSGTQKLRDLTELMERGATDELPDYVIESLAVFLPKSSS